MSKMVKVRGWILGSAGDCKEIFIVKEKILCIEDDDVHGVTIHLEGGVCVCTHEPYYKVLDLIIGVR